LVPNGRPTFIYNFLGLERYTIASSEPLPRGACSIGFDFAYDGGGMGKGGAGTLSVNGQNVGEGRIERTVPIIFSTDDTFDVGEDWGTPVSPTYEAQFKFTGILKRVTVEAKGAKLRAPLVGAPNFRRPSKTRSSQARHRPSCPVEAWALEAYA
jgi:arylsulfatase